MKNDTDTRLDTWNVLYAAMAAGLLAFALVHHLRFM
jgi:hypothetical protein